MASAARFFLKVYDSTRATYRQTIPANLVIGLPKITREVKKPASDITIGLALPWDNFGFGQANGINRYDFVKVYAQNENNMAGTVVYQGFITEIHALFDEKQNYIELRLLPIDSLLGNALYYTTPFIAPVTHLDASTVMTSIINDCMTVQSQAALFTLNLAAAGLNLLFNLTEVTHLDAINKIATFLPNTWYWRIRPNGQVDLQQWNDGTADHFFTLGKDVEAVDLTDSILDLKNSVALEWGTNFGHNGTYNNAPSQAAYGFRQVLLKDDTFGDSGTADTVGNGSVSRRKDPVQKCKLTINTNFPIETILAGDTCRILNNTNVVGQMLPSTTVYRIVRVEYDGRVAVLTLSQIVGNFGTELGILINNLN